MPVGDKQIVRFGPFELDPQCGQLRKNGMGLKLHGQPVQILELLLEKPGELVSREEIRNRLWTSETFVDFEHSLNTAIKKLRQALGDEADTPSYIETLPKRGYRFIGEIEREEPADGKATAPSLKLDDTTERIVATLAEAAISASEKSRKHRRMFIGISAMAVLLTGAITYWLTESSPMPRIVGSHVLVKTGYNKFWLQRLLTDGNAVYFEEKRPTETLTFRATISGEDVSELPTQGGIADITKDGTRLLVDAFNDENKRWDVVSYLLPSGPSRLIVKDGGWAFWGADGHSVFFTRNDETEIWRAQDDGTGVRMVARFPNVSDPRLSPDGSRIRFRVYPELTLWEVGVDGRNAHQILSDYRDYSSGSWSPDGKFYFFRAWDGDRFSLFSTEEVRHWWTRKKPIPQKLTIGPMSLGQPLVSRDGKQIFATGIEHHGELVVYDAKTRQFVPYLSGISACFVDFSRDGQWLAYVSYPEGTLWRSRVDGRDKTQLTLPPMAVMSPRWSPDGKLIAFTELAGGDRRRLGESSQIYAVSADGGAPMLLLGGASKPSDPTWSPDGNSIAYSSRSDSPHERETEIRVLDLHTQKSTKVPGSERKFGPRFSPDGQYLLALDGPVGSGAKLWAPTKLVLFTFATGVWEQLPSSDSVGWPSWSLDSKFIYVNDADIPTRIELSTRKKKQISPSLADLASTAFFLDRFGVGWFGVTPDGRPLITRDTGTQQIYAFDLEYK